MGSLPRFPLCIRDAAAHMASRAQVFYLPVGTKHHFSELAQILSLLQKDLRGPAVRGTGARTTGLSLLSLSPLGTQRGGSWGRGKRSPHPPTCFSAGRPPHQSFNAFIIS